MKRALTTVLALVMSGVAFGQSGLQSDPFTASTLNSFWTFSDPIGTGSYVMTGTSINVTVPAGSQHDSYTSESSAIISQTLPNNSDFSIKAEFDTKPTVAFQGFGLHAIHDNSNFVRCSLYAGTAALTGYASYVTNGTVTQLYNSAYTSPGTKYWLRLAKSGTTYTCQASVDGTNFTTFATMTYSNTIAKVAITTDNGSNNGVVPAFTNQIADFVVESGGNPPPPPPAAQCISPGAHIPSSYPVPDGALHTSSFGATGNGTTDDTAALNAAINSVPSGGTLVFDPGTFKLSGHLVITNKSATYMVASPGTVILKAASESGGQSIFYASPPASNVTIEGFVMDGGGIGAFNASKTNPPSNWHITGNKFQNLFAGGGSNLQIYAIGSDAGWQNSSIDNNIFSHAIQGNSTRGNCTINGVAETNYQECPAGGGIKLYNLDTTHIDHNTFDHVGEAMAICFTSGKTSGDLFITNNHFTSVHRMSFEFQGPNGCGGTEDQNPQGVLFNSMDISGNQLDNPWDAYWNTFFVSSAVPVEYWNFTTHSYCSAGSSGCVQVGGHNISVHDNYLNGATTDGTIMSLMIELGGENATAYRNYMFQGKMQAGIQPSKALNGTIHDNYLCTSVSTSGVPYHDEQDNPTQLPGGDPNQGTNALKWNEKFTNNKAFTSCPATLFSVSMPAPTVDSTAKTISATATISGVEAPESMNDVAFNVDTSSNLIDVGAPPFSFTQPTTGISNGSHTLTAVATDKFCNSQQSSAQPFTIVNTAPSQPPGWYGQFTITGQFTLHP